MSNDDLKYGLRVYEELYSPQELQAKPFYNIGAGDFYHPYWTNLDHGSQWYNTENKPNFIEHDLRGSRVLPIEPDSAIACYTSHVIEHIEEKFVLKMFREVFTSLRQGGVFRVQTGPDAETDFRAMMRGDANWFWWDKKLYSQPGKYEHNFFQPADSVPIEERWLYHVASQLAPNAKAKSDVKFNAEQVRAIIAEHGFEGGLNYLTSHCRYDPERPGNHMSWWTNEKVVRYLKEAGFTTVYRSGFRQSTLSILRNTNIFDRALPEISIYVEAIKE